MRTDEGSTSESESEDPKLEDLFSTAREDPVENDEPTESETVDSASDVGMETEIPADGDDGEILTDSSGESDRLSPNETATPDRTTSLSTDPDTLPGRGESTTEKVNEVASRARKTSTVDRTGSTDGEAEILDGESLLSDDSDGRPNGTSTTDPVRSAASNRLTTGNADLDRELQGGIPPGRMLTLVAPPETQSELLVKEMASARPTVYISTFRPEWEIREELQDHLQKSVDKDGLEIEIDVSYVDPETLLSDPMQFIGDLQKGSNFIIDSINEFELKDRNRYVKFLNIVKEVLWDTGSVGLFYVIGGSTDSPARALTLKRSDVVWELDKSVTAREIETMLVVSKFRGGKALTEPIKLKLTDDVRVVTNWDGG